LSWKLNVFIFDKSTSFINQILDGFWILGDNVFFIVSDKIERKRKKNKLFLNNEEFQVYLDKFYTLIKISSKWGIKNIKNS
jgi:hypothetical protein